jgi:hypothetical protein
MRIEKTDLSNKDFFAKTGPLLTEQELRAENDRLRKIIADLLPWAKAGATRGVTDSTWDEAQDILRRITRGEMDV